MRGKIVIDTSMCKGCQLCIGFCPKKNITVSGDLNEKGYFPAQIDPKKPCTGCGICALMCPEAAIEVYRDDED
jgi:2-oxoglutarate ferredoxin oxidoreductase subunit delta